MKKQNHTSHRTLHTSQKGITLIALIITIIVMLILVGVTINVALNGGLFTKADEATKLTQIEAEKEELLSAVVAAIGTNAKVDFNYLDDNLPAGWSKVADKTYKSLKQNIYEVDEYGKITYKGDNVGGENTPEAFNWETVGLTVDTNTEYICGGFLSLIFSKDGKLTVFNLGIAFLEIDATDSKYVKDSKIDFIEEIDGEKTRVKLQMNTNNTDIDIVLSYFEEDGTENEEDIMPCVKVSLEADIETGIKKAYSNAEVIQAVEKAGGTYTGGTYKGTWTVLERDASGNPTKLVSTTAVTNVILGEYNNLEKSISDYKNAVSILNTAAQTATGITGARSITVEDIYGIIGEGNIDKGENYGRVYNYYYNADEQRMYSKYKKEDGNWSDSYDIGYSGQRFVDDNENIVVVDSIGDEVTLTYTYYDYSLTDEQKAQIGTLASGYYWLASPCVKCSSYDAYFYVHYMFGDCIYGVDLFGSNGSARGGGNGWEVRAVVSVSGGL